MSIWQLGEKINGNDPDRRFGRACSINSTGDVIACSASGPGINYVGVYQYDGSSLVQL